MNLRELNYLLCIAKNCTISKAAEELYLSQPSLSLFLINLEKRLGVKLFERVNKKMHLTYAGEQYIDAAKKIISTYENVETLMGQISNSQVGRLRIGCTPARARYVFPIVIPEFVKIFPKYSLQLIEGSPGELEKMLSLGDLDIILYTAYNKISDFSYVKIKTEETVLCTPNKEKYLNMSMVKEGFSQPWIHLDNLKNETFLLVSDNWRIGCASKEILKEENMMPLQATIQFSTVETSVEAVSRGLGVCFCSNILVNHFFTEKPPLYFSVGKQPKQTDFVIAYRKDYEILDAQNELIQLVKKHFDI